VKETMSLKIISKHAFPAWVDRLVKKYRVIGPKSTQIQAMFDHILSGDEIVMDYSTTLLPPKKALLPPCDSLFKFGKDGSEIEPLLDDHPTVIIGIHTCDMHAITLLDKVFAQGFPDQHYLTRREHTTLVSIECLKPCSDQAFCKDLDTHIVPEQFDLHLTDIGDAYGATIGSEKGARLLMLAEMRKTTSQDYDRLSKTISEKWGRFPYRLEAGVMELPSLFSTTYRNVQWEQLGDRCLGCGSCTLVCPTCYCFDIRDEVDFTLKSGERYRFWDSCQLNEFALVAGGHDFRSSRGERLRHRFLHKFKYQVNAYETVGCVGCGRCAQTCLVGISPVEIINSIYKQYTTSQKQYKKVLV